MELWRYGASNTVMDSKLIWDRRSSVLGQPCLQSVSYYGDNSLSHLLWQVLHNLCMWSAADKSLSFEQAKDAARGAKKEHKMVRE